MRETATSAPEKCHFDGVRAHLRNGKDRGDAGTRVEGTFPTNGGDYDYD